MRLWVVALLSTCLYLVDTRRIPGGGRRRESRKKERVWHVAQAESACGAEEAERQTGPPGLLCEAIDKEFCICSSRDEETWKFVCGMCHYKWSPLENLEKKGLRKADTNEEDEEEEEDKVKMKRPNRNRNNKNKKSRSKGVNKGRQNQRKKLRNKLKEKAMEEKKKSKKANNKKKAMKEAKKNRLKEKGAKKNKEKEVLKEEETLLEEAMEEEVQKAPRSEEMKGDIFSQVAAESLNAE